MVQKSSKLCAPHVVSPRDLWRCVLPRWQFNVNVNTSSNFPVDRLAGLGLHVAAGTDPLIFLMSVHEPPKVQYAKLLESVTLPQNIVAPTGDEEGLIATQLAAYGTAKGPGESFPLFPNGGVARGEVVDGPPPPKSRRAPCPEGYRSRNPGQNHNWVDTMLRTTAPRKAPLKAAPPKPRPGWVSAPTATELLDKWRTIGRRH